MPRDRQRTAAKSKPAGPRRSPRRESAKQRTTAPKQGPQRGRQKSAPSAKSRRTRDFPIVGVGASAGGLEALERLLRAVPADARLALILVQHLDPSHKSRLGEILSRATAMPVLEATDGMRVDVGHVYTIPPNARIQLRARRLHVEPRQGDGRHFMPINDLLRSLAEASGDRCIGVVLSGTASDGADGMAAIKDAGGATLAQDAGSARYFDMPRAAIATGRVDLVLPPEEIGRVLGRLAADPRHRLETQNDVEPLQVQDRGQALRTLFRELHRAFGVDFSAYKQSTIGRRIRRRMGLHSIDAMDEYLRYVQLHPEELRALYREMFVGVTGFFREPETFAALRRTVFPHITKKRSPDEPIRIWVPGCSTGEEVYSIAISLIEHLKRSSLPIQVFGTDINEEAIQKARAGRYGASIARDVGRARLARFFRKTDSGYQIHKAVRDLCIFARHNVLRDPPFSRLDLLSCRNLLIYLGPGLQQKLVPSFHYGLRPDRYLLLGSAETIGGFSDLFDLVDRKAKIYVKKPGVALPRVETMPDAHPAKTRGSEAAPGGTSGRSEVDAHRDAADHILLNQYTPAAVLINEDMEILHFRGHTGAYLEPAPGAADLNLLRMTREGLLVGLQSALETARKKDVPGHAPALHMRSDERERVVDVHVVPVRPPISERRTFLVLFHESDGKGSSHRPEPRTAAPPDPAIAQLRQELAATKAYLQSLVENREAGNEELRSANEELLSTNEELQSTTEELETSNEELQSVNEELTTLNEELHRRNVEVGQAHSDIANLLAASGTSMVVVDRRLCVRRFTSFAEKSLRLHETHVGRPLSDIRLRVDVPGLEPLLWAVVSDGSTVDREVQDQSGRWYALRIHPFLTAGGQVDGAVLGLTDIHDLKETEARFRVALLSAPITVFEQDDRLRYSWIEGPATSWARKDVLGKTDNELFAPDEARELASIKRKVLKTGAAVRETVPVTIDGERRCFDLVIEPVKGAGGKTRLTGACWDVTEQAHARDEARRLAVLEERNRMARDMHDSLGQGLVGVILQLEAAEEKVRRKPEEIGPILAWARGELRRVLDETRGALLALRPRLLEIKDLPAALEQIAVDMAELSPASLRVAIRGTPRRLAAPTEEALLRIAQEAQRNAVQHAGAQRIVTELTFGHESARLRITDDGRGFDLEANRGEGDVRHMGLDSMRSRATSIGGRISIRSTLGKGTRVEVVIPHTPTKARRE